MVRDSIFLAGSMPRPGPRVQRKSWGPHASSRDALRSFRQAAVAAFALLKIEQGLQKLGAREIRPEGFGHINFGVGNLPEQKIADAHFAAGADEQVRIGQSGRVQVLGNHFLIDAGVGEAIVPHAIEDAIEGVDQLRAAAVIERYGELHARIARSLSHGAFHIGAHRSGQLVRPPDNQETDIIAMNDGQLFAEVLTQEAHQEIDFGFRAAPVFHGEGVESESGDIESGARFDYGSRGLDAGAMTRNSRQVTPLRPTSIAIHNYRDVLREPVGVELREEALFFTAGWF
jgi:hypothetical protein